MSIPVKGGDGEVIELCVAKYWDNLGTIEVQYSLEFHGLMPSQSKYTEVL